MTLVDVAPNPIQHCFLCRLKFFKPEQDHDKAERYRGQRDIESLTKFVQDQLDQPEAKEDVRCHCSYHILQLYVSV